MRLLLLLLATALLGAPVSAQQPVERHSNQAELLKSADPTLAANKKLVFDFWREVMQAHDVTKAARYVAENLVEHDPNLASGRAAFVDFNRQFPVEPLKPAIDDLVTLVAEGDRVVLAFRRELPDLEHEGQTYTSTWFEMVRIEQGKIAEHWSYGLR